MLFVKSSKMSKLEKIIKLFSENCATKATESENNNCKKNIQKWENLQKTSEIAETSVVFSE